MLLFLALFSPLSVCLSVCWLKDGVELLEKCRVVRSGRGRGVLVCAPDSMVLCDCELGVVTCTSHARHMHVTC